MVTSQLLLGRPRRVLSMLVGLMLVMGGLAFTAVTGATPAYAASPADGKAYVANGFGDSVSVIDTSTGAVVATVPVGAFPSAVAVKPDGTRAYVVNTNSNSVSVIDTVTDTVTATVTLDDAVNSVAVTPDGTRAYVTLSSGNVSVIDTATNTVVATVPVGSVPFGVAVTPDGTRAYVTNDASDNVSVIDTATNTVVATVAVGTYPLDVAVTPNGTRAYVLNQNSSDVSVIDTATNTVVATVAVAGFHLAVTPDGTRVYVTNGYTVGVIDTVTNMFTTVAVSPFSYGVAVSPDGTRAYLTDLDTDSVAVFDTATNTVVAAVPVGSFPWAVAFGPAAAVSNTAPVAVNDAYSTAQGTPLTVSAPGVLVNDNDADGDPLSAGSATTPAHGSVTLNADGSFTYTSVSNYNGPDSFTYVASDGNGGTSTATVNVSITAPTGPTTFSISDVSANEGNLGTTVATFNVNRSGTNSGTSTVKYKTVNGTATSPSDYAAKALTTLTFAPGEMIKPVTVDVVGDGVWEKTETFRLALSYPTGATIADNSGLGTIVNDDPAATFAIGSASVTEGNAGTTNATFTITRSGNANGAVSVKVKSANGSATLLYNDYVAFPLTKVNFADGQSTATVNVAVNGDTLHEKNETFKMVLSSPVGATISGFTGIGTIVNDD